MAKHRVILAELDAEYIFPLELKFLEEMQQDIELEVITDEQYFNEYFERPKKAEILIVSEELYTPQLKQHNINNIFVLSESNMQFASKNDDVQMIYKYTSIKHVFNQVMFSISGDLLDGKIAEKETEIIMVYSAIGGSGKTSISLGLASSLTQNYKRVLYIDAEYIQNAQYFFKNQIPIPTEAVRQLQNSDTQLYQNLNHCIRNEYFDYLPPFRASLSALNLNYRFFLRFIQEAKATKRYDYIVVDTDCIFDEGKIDLIDAANHVILVMMQDGYSVMKTNMLLNSVDFSDNDKITYVCNAYRPDRKNTILEQKYKYIVNGYIEWCEQKDTMQIEDFMKIDGIQKLTFELL